MVYIFVTDIEAYRQKAVELGGEASPVHEIPGHGCISYLTDLEGSIVGIFQPK